jgi:hypothetical protein
VALMSPRARVCVRGLNHNVVATFFHCCVELNRQQNNRIHESSISHAVCAWAPIRRGGSGRHRNFTSWWTGHTKKSRANPRRARACQLIAKASDFATRGTSRRCDSRCENAFLRRCDEVQRRRGREPPPAHYAI